MDERLRYHASLMDNIDDAVIGTDADFRVTVWNPGAQRLYGYSADEVVGRPAWEVTTHEGDDSRLRLESELREMGRTRIELAARRKDGTFRVVELISVVVRHDDGEIVGYLGIHRDITDRRRAEEALRQSQRRSQAILESITDAFVALDPEWRFTHLNERALAQSRAVAGRDTTLEELIGKTLWDLAPQLVGTIFDQEFHRALRDQTVVEFEGYWPSARRWIAVRAYPSKDGLSVYSHDISARKASEEGMSRRMAEQALLADLGLRTMASDDVQALMDEAVELVADALEVEMAGVAEILPGGRELLLRAGVGWQPGTVGVMKGPSGRGSLVGYIFAVGEPVVSDDVAADSRFTVSQELMRHGVVSAASVLITGSEEPFGSLGVFSRRRRTFSTDEVRFLQTVAYVISTALERAAARRRLEEVREGERSRIARDLHDDVLQGLTHALTLSQSRAASGAEGLGSVLQRVTRQLRAAIHDLRIDDQRERLFSDALRELVEVHRAMADCELLAEFPELPAGSSERRASEVLRIIGEALTNARRHAAATQILVRVKSSETRLSVEIIDDGRGFDAERQLLGSDGQGLKGMRERADLLEAHLQVRSDQAGTTVRLHVDLSPRPTTLLTRVLLVEDHGAVRQALAEAFARHTDIEVVGEAASMAEARTHLEGVDVAVIDLGLPDGYGADLIRDLRTVNPQAQALVLSATLDPREIARAVACGAGGVLHKTTYLGDVVAAIRRLRAGEMLLSLQEIMELQRLAGAQHERERDERAAIAQLTPREREILQGLADGMNSQEIADHLYISVRTARNHITNIFTKLNVHSQIQALLLALRYEIVSVPRTTGLDPRDE